MRYRLRWDEWVIGVVLALSLAILTTFVSHDLGVRETTRAETIENQSRLLRGESFLFGDEELFISPHYNRVIIPLLLQAGVATGTLSVEGWYLLIRIATAFLAFFAFWWGSFHLAHNGIKGRVVGALLLGYGFIITFNYYVEYPIDFLEVAFFALFVVLAVRRQYYALLLFAILGSLNRESAAFTAVLWGVLHGFDERWRPRLFELLRSGLLAIGAYGTALIARVVIAGPQALRSTQWLSVPNATLLAQTLDLRNPFNSLYLSVSVILLVWVWLYLNRIFLDSTMRRLLLASIGIALISSVFGFFYELRIYLPSIVIVTMVAAAAENQASPTTGVVA